MKKLFNLFWLRSVEVILNVILILFVFFGKLDSEIGLTLNSAITWVPFTLLIILLVLVLLEFVNDKPYIRAVFLFLAVVVCAVLLYEDTIETTNASCWFMGLVYVPFLLFKYIKTKTVKNTKMVDKNAKSLPVGFFTRKQLLMTQLMIFCILVVIGVFIILEFFVWKHKVVTI